MTARCTGEPLSWPRLERLVAGDLRPRDAAAARAHLAACPACQACLARIQADAVDLPRLPVLAPPPRPRWWLLGVPMAALAAVALWLAVRTPDSRDTAAALVATVAVKGGGTLTLSLVRERDGVIAIDPPDVRDDDRWKVRLTCDRPVAVTAAITVHQPGQPGSSPLPPAVITCGNDVTLPGAFHVTGGAATVCVTVDGAAPACRALATAD